MKAFRRLVAPRVGQSLSNHFSQIDNSADQLFGETSRGRAAALSSVLAPLHAWCDAGRVGRPCTR